MFPTDDETQWASQYLRCYSENGNLICRGDGETAVAKVETINREASSKGETISKLLEMPCNPDRCPMYKQGYCRRVMNLQFLLPDCPGFGVYQLDTSSFYSIVNINSCVDLIRRICGRISFIPLVLSLEPIEVTPPGIKKKTVHVLAIRSDVKLVDIQRLGKIPPERILLPSVQEEEPPEDLFPEQTLVEAEAREEQPPAEPVEEKTTDDVTEDDVPDLNAVFRVAWYFWQMQPIEVCRELGYRNQMDAYQAYESKSGWEAWLVIKNSKHAGKE